MRRWLYTYQIVRGPWEPLQEALLSRGHDLIAQAGAAVDAEVAVDGSLLLEFEGHVAGIDFGKQVRVSTGVGYLSGRRMILPITWHAEPARAVFPVFEGAIELEPMSHAAAQLTLTGSYDVPLGPLGAVIDATILRDVATRTAERLLAPLARELQRVAGQPDTVIQLSDPHPDKALRVADVMTENPVVLDAELPLRTAALLLFHYDISGAPVVDARGALVGVLSERDLLAKGPEHAFGLGRKVAEEHRRHEAMTVGEACTTPAQVTVPAARLSAVAREMLDEDVARLVVVDAGKVAGIVTRHDVLAALFRDDREIEAALREALDASGAPELQAHVEWGKAVLTGTTRLRSTAAQVAEVAESVDGVMNVDDDGVRWTEDDVTPVTSVPFT